MTTIEILKSRIEYTYNGKLHRTDGPAVVFTNGHKEWHINGILHRLDGPAVEHTTSYKEWYEDGELHRTDGPAKTILNKIFHYYEHGSCYYENDTLYEVTRQYLNGVFHCTNGPALITSGCKKWYINGKLHREDGPAVEWTRGSGANEYWLCGVEYSLEDYLQLLKLDKL